MKSYFAKLAARATLANSQVLGPVTAPKPRDTFSDTSGFVGNVSRHHIEQRKPSRNAADRGASQSLLRSEDIVGSRTERVRPSESRLPNKRSQTVAQAAEPPPIEQLSAEITPQSSPKLRGRVPRSDTQARSRGGREDAHQLLPPENTVSTIKASIDSEETNERNPARDETTRDHAPDTQSDESVLLRRADAFMETLFTRRPTVAPNESESEDEKELPAQQSVVPRETAVRLQPLPRTPQVAERADEQSSLIIENLTVEVVPPAPAMKPQRQVVVVRGARTERRSVPSSQRFGLTQF